MTATQDLDKLLNVVEAAAVLNIQPQTLACWRTMRRYPLPYVRIGRAIRYRVTDLQVFIASRTIGAADESAAPAPIGAGAPR